MSVSGKFSRASIGTDMSSKLLGAQFLLSEDKEIEQYCDATQVVETEVPNQKQLTLLCLDYLRSLRRSRVGSQTDLETEIGINQDYITIAIWALSKSFSTTPSLSHGNLTDVEKCLDNPLQFGNDPFFQPTIQHFENVEVSLNNKYQKISNEIFIPSLEMMEYEMFYMKEAKKRTKYDLAPTKNDFSSSKFEYEDAHQSNQFRFYKTMGLSSDLPLTLEQIATRGIRDLDAKSRMQAEENMMAEPLFNNFIDAVTKQGFFKITEKEILNHPMATVDMKEKEIIEINEAIHEERFRQVVVKFRTKLAANYDDDDEQSEEAKEMDIDHEEEDGKSAQVPGPQGDDETLIAESVYEDVHKSDNEMDDDGSKVSKTSRASRHSLRPDLAQKRDLETAERLKGYGNVAMQKKKYDKAKNYYTKALELIPAGPTSHVYFSNRAAALLSMRNFNEAVWDAERSIALKPDYAKAHARLGLANFLLERFQEAVDSYTLAVRYDPDNATSASYLEKSKKKLQSAKDIAFAEEYMTTNQKKKLKEPETTDDSTKSRKTSVKKQTNEPTSAAKSVRIGDTRSSSDRTLIYKNMSRARSQAPKRRASLQVRKKPEPTAREVSAQNSRKSLDPSIVYKPGEDPPEERDTSPVKSMAPTEAGSLGGSPRRNHTSRSPLRSNVGSSPSQNNTSLSPQRNRASQSPLRNRAGTVRASLSPRQTRFMNVEESRPAKKNDPPLYTASNDSIMNSPSDQEEADRLKGEGNKAMARKQYEKAVRYYSKALRLSPAGNNSHVYFSNRAAALCYLERYEEAELDAERSLALHPEYGKAHARLGLSRYFLRDYYGAIEAYESALFYDPGNAASKSYLLKSRAKISNRRHSSAKGRLDVE